MASRPGRRRGQTLAADLLDDVHVALGFLHAFFALDLVIDDPLGEADGAGDRQAGIPDALAQVFEIAAAFDMLVQLANPRLNRLVAGLGGNLHLLHDRQLLPVDGAGVQAVAKRLILGLILGFGRGRCDGAAAQPRSNHNGSAREPLPAGKSRVHRNAP